MPSLASSSQASSSGASIISSTSGAGGQGCKKSSSIKQGGAASSSGVGLGRTSAIEDPIRIPLGRSLMPMALRPIRKLLIKIYREYIYKGVNYRLRTGELLLLTCTL